MTSAATLRVSPHFPDLLRNWRKIRKISQWNLSLVAGVSQRHLSFLESGRSSPSRDMVILLAKSLELPLREQNGLLNSAGFASVYSHSSIDQKDLEQAHHALGVMLKHHEPYPAVVIDRNWNILMMNDANMKVFSLLLDPIKVWDDIAPGKPPNVLRMTLHSKGLKPFVTNWAELAAYFVNQLTTELAMNPYNSEAKELMDEISDYPDIPDPHFIPTGSKPYLTFGLVKGTLELSFFTLISTFGTPLDVTLQEIRIETFFAADKHTDELVKSL